MNEESRMTELDADCVGPPMPPSPSAEPAAAPDPFDPMSLRLDEGSMSLDLGVNREIVTIPVRKPAKDEWVRVNPDEAFTLQTGVVELKTERETYLVARPLWPLLANESTFSCRTLFSAVTRAGVFLFWPVRLPGPDGRLDSWNAAAMQAALFARTRWVRMAANMSLGAYDVTVATARIADPVWPEKSMRDLLSIAFHDRFIDTMNHPALRRLRGEI